MWNRCLWCHFRQFYHQNIEKLWYPRRRRRLIRTEWPHSIGLPRGDSHVAPAEVFSNKGKLISNIKGERHRFWVFDCIVLLDRDTWIVPKKTNLWRQVCHRLSVNTGKFMVYCRSLTWLSPLGKPKLWRRH
jgi:hypothetical protein